jgi:cytochrome b involved in lipid metabolism
MSAKTEQIQEISSADRRSVAQLVASLPRDLFNTDASEALKTLLTTLALAILIYVVAPRLPWYSLPIVWVVLGALYAGLSAVAQDCAQNTFSRYPTVNYVVGTIVSLPLMVPFVSWSVQHKQKLMDDVFHHLAAGRAWVFASVIETLRSNFAFGSVWIKGSRRLVVASFALLWAVNFAVAYAFVSYYGLWFLIKYWIMPWCAYLFWRSVFLQTAYRLPFTDKEIRISLAFPEKYPKWVQLLTNDLSTVLTASRIFSHYVSQKSQQLVPNRNIKAAYNFINRGLGHVFKYDVAVAEETEKERIMDMQVECDDLRTHIDFGRPLDDLPVILLKDFKAQGRAKKWVACDGLVFDLKDFHARHPGGMAILEPFFGNDITRAFNGAVYNHNNAARNLSRHFIVARLETPQ